MAEHALPMTPNWRIACNECRAMARLPYVSHRHWCQWSDRYLQAAILLGKWPNFARVEARGQIGASYSRKLRDAGVFTTPQLAAGNTSVYAQYTVQVEHRAEVQAQLKRQGIPTAVHYPMLLCQQPALRCHHSLCIGGCHTPIAQAASERVMSLPMHPWLSEADKDSVVDGLVRPLNKR